MNWKKSSCFFRKDDRQTDPDLKKPGGYWGSGWGEPEGVAQTSSLCRIADFQSAEASKQVQPAGWKSAIKHNLNRQEEPTGLSASSPGIEDFAAHALERRDVARNDVVAA